MKKNGKTLLLFLLALGWWGAIYPEFTITPETCQIVWEKEGQEIGEEADFSGMEIYEKLLSAEPEQIKIKSRLLEWLTAYLEKR